MATTLKEKLLTIWKDLVWAGFISTVLSAAFLALVGLLWILLGNHTFAETYALVLKALAYRVPVYVFLSLLGAYFIVKLLLKLVKKKPDPIWDLEIGNYRFGELFDILSSNFLPVQTRQMQWNHTQPRTDNLLMLFMLYNTFLNRGISLEYPNDDGGFGWGILSIRLMEYGLVNRVSVADEEVSGAFNDVFFTSEVGAKFHANVENFS
jgi:hypothetical protein